MITASGYSAKKRKSGRSTDPRDLHEVELDGPARDSVPAKKSILIYSPDMNFCFSLSAFFQDRFNVITTTDPGLLETLAPISSTSLLIIDEGLSEEVITLLKGLRARQSELPVIMLYVYGPGDRDLDRSVRKLVSGVFYKPFNVHEITRTIEELTGG